MQQIEQAATGEDYITRSGISHNPDRPIKTLLPRWKTGYHENHQMCRHFESYAISKCS